MGFRLPLVVAVVLVSIMDTAATVVVLLVEKTRTVVMVRTTDLEHRLLLDQVQLQESREPLEVVDGVLQLRKVTVVLEVVDGTEVLVPVSMYHQTITRVIAEVLVTY